MCFVLSRIVFVFHVNNFHLSQVKRPSAAAAAAAAAFLLAQRHLVTGAGTLACISIIRFHNSVSAPAFDVLVLTYMIIFQLPNFDFLVFVFVFCFVSFFSARAGATGGAGVISGTVQSAAASPWQHNDGFRINSDAGTHVESRTS